MDHGKVQAGPSIHCIETGIIDHEVTIAGGTAGQVSVVLPSWYNGSRFDFPECQG